MSVNSYLNDLAQRAIVRDNEKNKIESSIHTIFERLKYFDENRDDLVAAKNQIGRYFIFGSYKRKTIISQEFDKNSDVDIMVIFGKKFEDFYAFESRNNYPKKPQTYLNYLKNFAESKYPNSLCRQSFPAVVLELNHIKFDLVPAIADDWNHYKIPNKQNWYQTRVLDWITTNPNDLDKVLTNNQTLRRLVRVCKVWNAKQGYIYESYELEKWITQQYFNGDLAEHFYQFCELLPIHSNLSQDKRNEIKKLKRLAKESRDSNNEYYIKDLLE